MGAPGCVNEKNPSEREFVFDSGAILHRVSKRDLTLLSWRPWGHQEVRRRPTARFKPEKKRLCMSSNWTCSSKVCFLKKLPQFFPWRNSVRIMGIYTPLDKRSKTTSHPKWKANWLQHIEVMLPCVVRGSSASSSSITPSHISPFIFIIGFRIRWVTETKIQYPKEAQVRVKFREDPLHESTEAEKWESGCVGLRRDLSHELPEWLQEFSENVVDESVPAEPRRNP